MAWETPVFDRTFADANTAEKNQGSSLSLKGSLNISDLNRIEHNTIYLRDILAAYGYNVEVITHADWIVSDLFYLTDMDRIRQNVINLLDKYNKLPTSPTITLGNYYLTVTDINDIEKGFYDINFLLENMVAEFRYCGTIYAGGYYE